MAEPWRRTGRVASDDHFLGLGHGLVLEAAAYGDDRGQQGHLLLRLEREVEALSDKGATWLAKGLAVQDEYYAWWLEKAHGPLSGPGGFPVHFCRGPVSQCQHVTMFRDVVHIDVFRALEGAAMVQLRWLSAGQKAYVQESLEGLPLAEALTASGSGAALAGRGWRCHRCWRGRIGWSCCCRCRAAGGGWIPGPCCGLGHGGAAGGSDRFCRG
jgi:hypothetical protein